MGFTQTIEELEQEISRLRERLDIERRYLEDKKPRYFKSWLRKQPLSLVSEILLGEQLIPNRGSRSLYQAHVKRLVPDEMEDFVRLWKLMLLTERVPLKFLQPVKHELIGKEPREKESGKIDPSRRRREQKADG